MKHPGWPNLGNSELDRHTGRPLRLDDDSLVGYLTQWLGQSGYARDYERARAEAEGFVNWYHDKTRRDPSHGDDDGSTVDHYEGD